MSGGVSSVRSNGVKCERCKKAIRRNTTGRPRRFCSDSCRVMAARKRMTQAAKAERNNWWTPDSLRQRVLADYDVTLDAAACADSALVAEWLGPTHPDEERRDALSVSWGPLAGDGVVWLNPPYGKELISPFMQKVAEEAANGTKIVALVKAAVGTKWWRDCVTDRAEVEFLTGRLKFGGPHSAAGESAPFDSALLFYGLSVTGGGYGKSPLAAVTGSESREATLETLHGPDVAA